MAFKVTKEQLASRDVLAADLRAKAIALNAAIAAFNREVGPLARAVAETQANYNETVEQARRPGPSPAKFRRLLRRYSTQNLSDGRTATTTLKFEPG